MPIDPFAALNAMLRAEAARFTVPPPSPKPAPERADPRADPRSGAEAPTEPTPGS
ncbi:hypothetical protein ABZY31_00270 [Streptomyces sp. NPDC006529]|uniref:hypothetical protein n=1 Tax=Streptomyces sp. NPDC006529 TaxID=3157177 RepID=UPI0033AF9914